MILGACFYYWWNQQYLKTILLFCPSKMSHEFSVYTNKFLVAFRSFILISSHAQTKLLWKILPHQTSLSASKLFNFWSVICAAYILVAALIRFFFFVAIMPGINHHCFEQPPGSSCHVFWTEHFALISGAHYYFKVPRWTILVQKLKKKKKLHKYVR